MEYLYIFSVHIWVLPYVREGLVSPNTKKVNVIALGLGCIYVRSRSGAGVTTGHGVLFQCCLFCRGLGSEREEEEELRRPELRRLRAVYCMQRS